MRDAQPQTTGIEAPAEASSTRPWITDGVTLPHDTEFRIKYKGSYTFARVEDGGLVVKAKRFASLSAAATSIAGVSVNGWKL